MSVVRQEFGPTLPELVGPRVRALPRAAQLVLAAVAALVVVVLALVVLRGTEDTRAHAVVRAPIAYNLVYPPSLQRVRAHAGRDAAARDAAGHDRAAVVRRQAVHAAALPRRLDRDPHADEREHDHADARAVPRLHLARRRARQLQPPAGLRDPVPGEDRRPHDLRPPHDARPRRRHAAARGRSTSRCSPRGRPRSRASTRSARRRARSRPPSARFASAPSARERDDEGQVTFDDFAAVDMRVGRIVEVEDFPEARRPGVEAARRLRPRDRRQALVGADQELRARGARGAARDRAS